MEASEWSRFGLDENEAGALLRQADDIADKMTFDPDVRADLSQEALYEALKHLSEPPDGMPDSGLSRLRWLRTAMWRAANRFNTRRAFDTPLGHDGLPHTELQMVELHDNAV